MKRLSILKSNRGFGIMEAMITASILAFIALAGAGIATIVQHGNDYGDRKNEQRALAALIAQNLQHSSTCDLVMGPSSGLGLAVPATITDRSSTSPTSGWAVTLKLANIKANADMAGDRIQATTLLPLKRLQVDNLRFADAIDLGLSGGNETYLASLFLKTSGIGSIAHKEILVGTYTIQADAATGAVKSCQSTSSTSFENTCNTMGCTYNAGASPPCKCLRTQVVCAAPGYVPVAFTADGLPDCRPIGGSVQCAASEFLVGVGIDWFKCAPAPTASPAPAPSTWLASIAPNILVNIGATNSGACTYGCGGFTTSSFDGNGGTLSNVNLNGYSIAAILGTSERRNGLSGFTVTVDSNTSYAPSTLWSSISIQSGGGHTYVSLSSANMTYSTSFSNGIYSTTWSISTSGGAVDYSFGNGTTTFTLP